MGLMSRTLTMLKIIFSIFFSILSNTRSLVPTCMINVLGVLLRKIWRHPQERHFIVALESCFTQTLHFGTFQPGSSLTMLIPSIIRSFFDLDSSIQFPGYISSVNPILHFDYPCLSHYRNHVSYLDSPSC